MPFAFDRLGVRVPAILVSPWIPKGTVVNRVFDHASIPATVTKFFLGDYSPTISAGDERGCVYRAEFGSGGSGEEFAVAGCDARRIVRTLMCRKLQPRIEIFRGCVRRPGRSNRMTIIHVPRPKNAFNPNRPVSALLKAQMYYLHEAERRLPLRYHTRDLHQRGQDRGRSGEVHPAR